MELSDAVLDDLDVEGVLGFAEHVLTNAARLWAELGIDGKQELQQALFPQGLFFDGQEFGTAVTSWLSSTSRHFGPPEQVWRPQGESHVCGRRNSKEKRRLPPERGPAAL